MLPLVGSAAVVIVGGRLAISGDLSVVDFSVFYTYVVMLVPSVQAVGLTLGQAQPAFASLRRVLEALREPVQRSPDEPSLPVAPAGVQMRGVRADTPGGDPILDGVNLDVPAGGTVAVLGTTGSGKSTLLALVNRLRDASGGSIEVAGAPVGEVEIGSLRRAVGTATDDNFIFRACSGRTLPTRGQTLRSRTWRQPRARRRPTNSSPPCRTGTTRSSGIAGLACREASGNGSRWRGRCWQGRPSAARQRHRQPRRADRGRRPRGAEQPERRRAAHSDRGRLSARGLAPRRRGAGARGRPDRRARHA